LAKEASTSSTDDVDIPETTVEEAEGGMILVNSFVVERLSSSIDPGIEGRDDTEAPEILHIPGWSATPPPSIPDGETTGARPEVGGRL
jgi:hypothetical protein